MGALSTVRKKCGGNIEIRSDVTDQPKRHSEAGQKRGRARAFPLPRSPSLLAAKVCCGSCRADLPSNQIGFVEISVSWSRAHSIHSVCLIISLYFLPLATRLQEEWAGNQNSVFQEFTCSNYTTVLVEKSKWMRSSGFAVDWPVLLASHFMKMIVSSTRFVIFILIWNQASQHLSHETHKFVSD